MKKIFLTYGLAALVVTWGAAAHSNTRTPPGAPLKLEAADTSGLQFTQDRIRGKVAIVFFWSTGCAVCRDSLPELRANLTGWRDKPFSLVTVNLDNNATDWQAYEHILEKTIAPPKSLIALRLNEGQSRPAKLPLTLLVDTSGHVVSRIEGRLAPEVWDNIADLMP